VTLRGTPAPRLGELARTRLGRAEADRRPWADTQRIGGCSPRGDGSSPRIDPHPSPRRGRALDRRRGSVLVVSSAIIVLILSITFWPLAEGTPVLLLIR
jgi:hypothetical protein